MNRLSDRGVASLQQQLRVPRLPARYTPMEIIGRGGMGVVWRTRDHVLERDVAVKVLAEHVADDRLSARLQREARILAQLEHPGIVTVHDAGTTDDGRNWYAMRLIRGRRLDERTGELATLGDVIRLMMRLAESVAFAHEHGIVHRDLKPANVMVGPFAEVLVLDWGVAGAIAGQAPEAPEATTDAAAATPGAVITGHGMAVGTPGYMAPEQAAGLPADIRSDVHGLGAIFRDLLAQQSVAIPRPLQAIVSRALAPDPAVRYSSAMAFADDLRRFQDGLPVSAHREALHEVVGRWISRYRTPVALVAAYLIVRLIILVWSGL